MKILLTNSPFRYYMTTAFFHPDWSALNLPQLAAMVEKKHQILLVDNWHGWFRREGIRRALSAFRPDVLGISNSTAADTDLVLALARQIRGQNPNLFMVIGGQAAGVRYHDCLAAGFDVVVAGEGEFIFKELIERLDRGERDFSDIAGLIYRHQEVVRQTAKRPLLKNLDQLPFPAWEQMPRFRSNFFPRTHVSVIESSRGCPFSCDFCAVQSFWERSYRKKSNERIVAEVEYLTKRLGCQQIYFIDDSFALNAKEYSQLFEMLLQRNLYVKGFSQIRPDTVANNPELIRLAARVGFWGFLVGFDSYDEAELKSVHKVGSAEINFRAADILRQNGIGIFGVHMFGMPGAQPTAFKRTFSAGMKNSDTFRMSRFSLIPGTPLFAETAARGQLAARSDRYVPYSHKVKQEQKLASRMDRLYVWYEFKSLFSPYALIKFWRARGIARILQWRAYLVAARYALYLLLRKIGFPVL